LNYLFPFFVLSFLINVKAFNNTAFYYSFAITGEPLLCAATPFIENQRGG